MSFIQVTLSLEGVPGELSDRELLNAFHSNLDGATLAIGEDGSGQSEYVTLHVQTVEAVSV